MTTHSPNRLEIHALTHPGQRPTNEDAVLVSGTILTGRSKWTCSTVIPEEGVLLAVADGVSGAPCAALASRRVLRGLEIERAGSSDLRPAALRAVQVDLAIEAAETRCFGMAACVAAILMTTSRVTLLHAGDCRIYRARGGLLEAQTRDHSAGAGMFRRGDAPAYSESDAASIYRGVESAVIADSAEADFEIGWSQTGLVPGDVWLLTTDGAHGAFALSEGSAQLGVLLAATTTSERSGTMRRLSVVAQRATADNVSLILVQVFA